MYLKIEYIYLLLKNQIYYLNIINKIFEKNDYKYLKFFWKKLKIKEKLIILFFKLILYLFKYNNVRFNSKRTTRSCY